MTTTACTDRIDVSVRWGAFLLVAGYLLFAHGCHGKDTDNELFAWKSGPAAGSLVLECK
jgi:hypothetical protein